MILLPKYFKTKNYSSFVRQLNMYGFHKVKSDNPAHEFKHPKFKRGELNEIMEVKRRIAEQTDTEDHFKGDFKTLLNEYNRVKKGHSNLEESLNIIAAQNKRLVETNKDLVVQLYLTRKEYELRMKKLVFIFFVLMENYTPELATMIKTSLVTTNLITESELQIASTPGQFRNFIQRIFQKLLFNKNRNDLFLDSMIAIFSSHLNSIEKLDSVALNTYQNSFDSMFNEDKNLRLGYSYENEPVAININEPSFLFPGTPLRLDRNISGPENSADLNSVYDASTFNYPISIAGDEISGQIDPLGIGSVQDKFARSEAASLHLFSPKNEPDINLR